MSNKGTKNNRQIVLSFPRRPPFRRDTPYVSQKSLKAIGPKILLTVCNRGVRRASPPASAPPTRYTYIRTVKLSDVCVCVCVSKFLSTNLRQTLRVIPLKRRSFRQFIRYLFADPANLIYDRPPSSTKAQRHAHRFRVYAQRRRHDHYSHLPSLITRPLR